MGRGRSISLRERLQDVGEREKKDATVSVQIMQAAQPLALAAFEAARHLSEQLRIAHALVDRQLPLVVDRDLPPVLVGRNERMGVLEGEGGRGAQPAATRHGKKVGRVSI
jgi:hypothetical protein